MFAFEPYDMDALLPAAKAAEMCSVSRQLFNWWVRTGKIQPVDDAEGRPRYRLRDAFEVEKQMRRSTQSRRKVGSAA